MRIRTLFLFFSFSFMELVSSIEIEEKEIVIVIPSYNNAEWYYNNITTAMNQEYTNFRIIYVNDCSTDGTGTKVEELARSKRPDSLRVISFDDSFSTDIQEVAEKFKEEVNRENVFFTLVNNASRSGALANFYRAIHSTQDEVIIVNLDGDDWLIDSLVLKRLNAVYASGEVWMTHGTLIEYPKGNVTWCEPVPSELIARNEVRQFKCPSHLRSYYSWIFKKIALDDLLYQGDFFPVTCDMAIMYPIFEMAAERHAFIAEPIYVYNMINPINDDKVNKDLQNELDTYIRRKERYTRLEKAEYTQNDSDDS